MYNINKQLKTSKYNMYVYKLNNFDLRYKNK